MGREKTNALPGGRPLERVVSSGGRGRLKNELEIARQENIKAKKDKQASRSYLFFVGAQDAKNPAIFHVLDHRLICTAHDELVFPVRS